MTRPSAATFSSSLALIKLSSIKAAPAPCSPCSRSRRPLAPAPRPPRGSPRWSRTRRRTWPAAWASTRCATPSWTRTAACGSSRGRPRVGSPRRARPLERPRRHFAPLLAEYMVTATARFSSAQQACLSYACSKIVPLRAEAAHNSLKKTQHIFYLFHLEIVTRRRPREGTPRARASPRRWRGPPCPGTARGRWRPRAAAIRRTAPS